MGPTMFVLAEQPLDALIGIGFLTLLFGGVWAFRYTERMWLRRGIDTTFAGFQIDHQSTTVMMRGLVAMLVSYAIVIGPVALIPTLCVELFGRDAFPVGSILGLAWMAFVITMGKAWLVPAVRKIFRIPLREHPPFTREHDHGPLRADERAM